MPPKITTERDYLGGWIAYEGDADADYEIDGSMTWRGSPRGFGKTEQEAIDDMHDQLADAADESEPFEDCGFDPVPFGSKASLGSKWGR